MTSMAMPSGCMSQQAVDDFGSVRPPEHGHGDQPVWSVADRYVFTLQRESHGLRPDDHHPLAVPDLVDDVRQVLRLRVDAACDLDHRDAVAVRSRHEGLARVDPYD